MPSAAQIPTVAEFVPSYEASSWFGVGTPRNSSPEIVDNLGGTVLVGSPADFRKLVADETDEWGMVVKFSGAKADWMARAG